MKKCRFKELLAMKKVYYPKGVCSRQMNIELENGIIKEVDIIGGCSGNLKGISVLVKGRKAEDIISTLRGIRCGFKKTSCPDQLATALEEALSEGGK